MRSSAGTRILSVLIPLLVLLLLLPFTDYGQSILKLAAEPANREELLAVPPPPAPEPEAEPEPSPAVVPPDFVGEYVLISVSGGGDDISEEDLARIRGLGIPLSLVIREDGSAQLEIFDETTKLFWTDGVLSEQDGSGHCSFLFEDGRLTLTEDEAIFLFEKLT